MRPQPDIGHDAPRWPGARRVILAFRWDHPRALWAYSSWEAAIAPAAGRMLSTTAASGSGPFGDNAAELIFAGRASIYHTLPTSRSMRRFPGSANQIARDSLLARVTRPPPASLPP